MSENSIIIIIDPDGKIYEIPKNPIEVNHKEVFIRANKIIPELLNEIPENISDSGGYEYSSYTAASGYAVLWPTDINCNKIMVLSIPKIPSKEQIDAIIHILPKIQDKELHSVVCYFKKRRSNKITYQILSGNGDFFDTNARIISYFSNIINLNGALQEERKLDIVEVNEDKLEFKKSNYNI